MKKEITKTDRKRTAGIGAAGRKGRLMLAALSAAVTLLTMAGLSAVTSAGVRTCQPAQYYRIITVHTNDTLWDIARENRAVAELPVRELVDDIMKVNQLKSPRIYTGQRLAVPCRSFTGT